LGVGTLRMTALPREACPPASTKKNRRLKQAQLLGGRQQ
jgi:hypothetical protein